MSREWNRGQPVPPEYSGMPVTFRWNEVALTSLLRVLREHYPSGYSSMVDHIRAAMANYTPPPSPRPDEPQGLGAVVEDEDAGRWVRSQWDFHNPWTPAEKPDLSSTSDDKAVEWSEIAAVRVLSPGVEVDQ